MADMGMGMMGAGEEPEEASSPTAAEPMDEESQAAVEAFPELEGDPVRIDALKTFVRLCAEKAMGGGYEEEGPPKKGGDTLALVFGGKPKGK